MSAPLRARIARWFAFIAYQGQSAAAVIQKINQELPDPRDQALARECLFGSARMFERLDWIASQLLQKPIKTKESEIKALIITALYQLYFLDIPQHAVISESVNATKAMNKDWAKGLVNAVLRNAQRRQAELTAVTSMPNSARFLMPDWLLKKFRKAWPQQWQSICEQSAIKAPMCLRLNQSHPQAEIAESLLQQANMAFVTHPDVPSAFQLEQACPVKHVPLFEDGLFSVQDFSAQLAAWILPIENNAQVLDACAAPGGKTAHLLERHQQRNIQLTALECDPDRAAKISETLQRLKLSCSVQVADATLWQGVKSFDAILIDAPCSATGIIRRQPDIKRHRQANDIAQITKLQKRILDHLWEQLTPGGYLLYATCSILPDENQRQIQRFLELHLDALLCPIAEPIAQFGLDTGYGLQIFPQHQHDGFFYALLQKQS